MKDKKNNDLKIECIGPDQKGGWHMVTNGISSDSIVYSIGIGSNITWDLALIERFGCVVHGFDPTPMSVDWVSKQTLPPQFVFHPVGLSNFDGTQTFFNAFKEGKYDMSVVRPNTRGSHQLAVKTLKSMMKELGHNHLDVLKIDIEGLEYDVIPTLLDVPVKQLMIEFHSRFFRFGFLKHWWARLRIRIAGYKLVAVDGEDHIFYRL